MMANVFPATELGQRAWLAFRRDLPGLLEGCQGQWAAYRGDQFLGTGANATDLYDVCLRQGVAPGDLVICQIEPILGEQALGMGGVAWRCEE
jgi:hypothetical protein